MTDKNFSRIMAGLQEAVDLAEGKTVPGAVIWRPDENGVLQPDRSGCLFPAETPEDDAAG